MGCAASKDTKNVMEINRSSEKLVATPLVTDLGGKRPSITKSHDSILTTSDSAASDKSTLYSGSEIFSPNRSRSVDLSRNGSAKSRSDPPTATATIIRKPASISSVETDSSASSSPISDVRTIVDLTKTRDVRLVSESGVKAEENYSTRRRSSDGDIGKVTAVTCIPGPLIKKNLLLSSSFDEMKQKQRAGPKNRRLMPTESQRNFFRMLDEKVAKGKDYCSSEDERSLSSIHSYSARTPNNLSSRGFSQPSMLQKVS